MSTSTIKRLQTELRELEEGAVANCTCGPLSSDDFYRWHATIEGPSGTSFDGGLFELDINIPSSYPFRPPKVKFVTKIFHPNISPNGDICLDILKENWRPVLTIPNVLLSISSLLTDPNPDSPLDVDASHLYLQDREGYEKKVKEYPQKYAM